MDPPYDGANIRYTSLGFDADDQELVRDRAFGNSQKGACVIVSNADTPLIRELYQDDFELFEVEATRPVNVDPNGRGLVKELLMRRHLV